MVVDYEIDLSLISSFTIYHPMIYHLISSTISPEKEDDDVLLDDDFDRERDD